MADRRAKRSEIWDSRMLVIHTWSILDLVVFHIILGSFGAVVLKWPVFRKWLVSNKGWPSSRTDWNLGLVDTSYTHMGYIWRCRFNVILESFGTLVSKWPVSHKRLVVEQNGLKFGAGILVTHIWGTFDLVGFTVILESFDALVLKCSVFQKGLVVRKNWLKFWTRGY